MVAISPKTLAMRLTIVCMAVLVLTGPGQAQLFPPIVPIGQQCLSSLLSIPGCVLEIFSSFFTFRIGIGPVCCQTITQITDNCWSKVFPFNPFFAPMLKNFCAAPSPKGTGLNAAAKFYLPGPLIPGLPGKDITQCWSSVTNIEGCVMDIYKSLTNGQIGVVGPACCEAVTKISDQCWPKMFPFSPFFPPLLKSFCAQASRAAPAPNEIGKAPPNLPMLP